MKDKNKTKSKIAVIIIGILTAIYSVIYLVLCISMFNTESNPLMFVFGLIPIAMLVAIICVVRSRMKEIAKGELDEARKY